MIMKIFQATSEIPGMTSEEVDRFLESKLNLQLATIDEQGWPNIHPVWFYYDKSIKYLGTLDHTVAKMITEGAKRGEVILIEISPKFFSTWDYSKAR